MKSLRLFSTVPSGIELDLQKEMNRTMHGAADEVAKGRYLILRSMHREEGVTYPSSSKDLISCPCKTQSLSYEPDKDYPCSLCDGEGYYFTDILVTGYRADRYGYTDVERHLAHGKNTISQPFFYIEYHEIISRYDKILEPMLDVEGNLISPIIVRERHNIHMAEPFRADRGRLEYWRLSCFTD